MNTVRNEACQDLLKEINNLLQLRDRHAIRNQLVHILMSFLTTRSIRWLHIIGYANSLRVHHLSSYLKDHNGKTQQLDHVLPEDIRILPLLDESFNLLRCFSDRTVLSICNEHQLYHYYLPLQNERDVTDIIQIECHQIIGHDQLSLIDELINTIRHQTSLLDYAEFDTLTELRNRKTFDRQFEGLLAETINKAPLQPNSTINRRHGTRPHQHYWLAVADIDHFKRINDRLGHLYGDEVLLLFARIMRNTFRITDKLYRFGGEEFVIILDMTEAEYAEQVLQRLRHNIENYHFPQIGQVTASIGFTQIKEGDYPAATFGRADEALYYAKQNGRNQVISYDHMLAAGLLKSQSTLQKEASNSDIELF